MYSSSENGSVLVSSEVLVGSPSALEKTSFTKLIHSAAALGVAKEVPKLEPHPDFSIKPHPNLPVNTEGHSCLSLRVVSGAFEELLNEFDIVFSSNLTSASVDAYLSGLPVIVMNAQNELNFCPLRENKEVRFVSTGKALAAAIEDSSNERTDYDCRSKFFFLDNNLSKWNKIIFEESYN